MRANSENSSWIVRTKRLTQALIVSGTLNVSLLGTFFYFVIKDKNDSLSIELKPLATETKLPTASNLETLRSYSVLSYQQLLLCLEKPDFIEQGIKKRDLALSCLVAFHHFNLDKALGGIPLQKRSILLSQEKGSEIIEVPVFPGLADYQFQAIVHFAKTEKWPFTSQGLFYELKRSTPPYHSSLINAFSLTSEYHSVYMLFSKTGISYSTNQLIDLLCEGEWMDLTNFSLSQRVALDLSMERCRSFLLAYLEKRSKTAALLLLESSPEFCLQQLEDRHILLFFDLFNHSPYLLKNLSKGLLSSPRTDAVWQLAAQALGHSQIPTKKVEKPEIKKPLYKTYKVQAGDNLWKIARTHKVSIKEIMQINQLETDKIRPGRCLQIPLR
ncbi:LysM peptidoglycan-binding domain-containing protein [Candidatus Rhabdochlamydia sp. T3358]|uniref:LysM peptidoglycan-binding domain-containing protein n=1 Tax=Candidatus Rhabdochlamydia sp. T3358 TaxID=2099795 RepID=UPI0010B9C6BB|nr:LysM peptidoglycan-binding domain-containing protein [Candidatus Rhabdochlamydia sp. T3358]VHO03973.1 D-gamma-glutamyl-meso-diaminopimelic acid endopeptidase CwlS precursor [Candidatus Rhabdochlamydia sp. T3358]